MSRPQPGLPSLSIDVGSLPVISYYTNAWRSLILANAAARREGKALLFLELSHALKAGAPLDEALAMAAQTISERRQEEKYQTKRGADTRNFLLNALLTIFFILPNVAALIYTVAFSGRMVSEERIARLLAMRLEKHVRKGVALSEAMERHRWDFEKEEVAIIKAAEKWGALQKGLENLAEFYESSRRIYQLSTPFLYPALLLVMAISVLSFASFFILPRFQDIFEQLGAELPAITSIYMDTLSQFTLLIIFIPFLVGYIVLHSLMNGTQMNKVIFTVLCIQLCYPLIYLVVTILSPVIVLYDTGLVSEMGIENFAYRLLSRHPFVGFLVMLIPVLFFPAFIGLIEKIILIFDKRLSAIAFWLPVFRGVIRAEKQGRWLAMFSLALSSKIPVPEAFQLAGATVGYGYQRRSLRAAALAEGGASAGDALARARILPEAESYRFAYAERASDFPGRLAEIAEDVLVQSKEEYIRYSAIAEVLTTVLIGIVLGLFVIAMYLPLFSIPAVVQY